MSQRYGQLKQTLDPLPGAHLTAAETAASQGEGAAIAEGRAGQAKGQALEQFGGTAAAIGTKLYADRLEANARAAKKAKDEEDNLVAIAAKNQLDMWQVDRLYSPETGALAQKGRATLGLPDQLGADFDKVTSDIESRMTSNQRALFAEHKAVVALNLHTQAMRHMSDEMTAYATDELNARVKNSTNLAIASAGDPRAVGQTIDSVVADIKASAPRLGLGPEEVAATVRATQTSIHKGVVERLLAEGQSTNAQIYFERAKSQISGTVQTELEKALEVGHTRNEAQTLSDKVFAEGGTLTEQRAKVKERAEGATRDEALQYLEHEHAVKKAADGQATEDLLNDVYTRVEHGASFNSITPSEQVQLGAHLPAIRAEITRLAKGDPVETDPATFYALLQQAQEDPASFAAKGNSLLVFKDRVAPDDLKHLMAIQMSQRENKPSKELDDYRQEAGIVDGALQAAGLDPTPKETEEKQRISNFRSLVAAEARRVQTETKKPISHADLEAIANRILGKQIIDKGWFTTGTKPLSAGGPQALPPPSERLLIEESLRGRGLPVTTDNVLDLWLKKQKLQAAP